MFDSENYDTSNNHTSKYDYHKYYYLANSTRCTPQFVNRTEELARLRDLYNSDEAELAVIFGRRRLGKTALVKESLKEHDDAVVYQAKQKTSALQLQQFIDTATESYPGVARIREDWDEVLGYLAEQDAIIVLDEFPYLVEQTESLPSVLQAMFDYELDESAATIVLVGSSISMMEDAALQSLKERAHGFSRGVNPATVKKKNLLRQYWIFSPPARPNPLPIPLRRLLRGSGRFPLHSL